MEILVIQAVIVFILIKLTTGEGGMLTCKDKDLAETIKIMRLHGMSRDAWKRYMPDSTQICHISIMIFC